MKNEPNKATWELIYFSSSQILAKSEKSIKLKFPDASPMKEYSFWLPKKLVKDENFASVKTDFEIKCRVEKLKEGKWTVDHELTLSGSAVVQYFEKYCEFYERERIVEIEPEILEPLKDVEPLKELMR